MGRGLGWVQRECLLVIRGYEDEAEQWPTTYDIAATVYQAEPDGEGTRWISNAQHVAVKRALEALQRKGRIIGFRDAAYSPARDGRGELCHLWMTEVGLRRWFKWREFFQHRLAIEKVEKIAKRALAAGMMA
jgi:hypothetical protein